MLQPQASDRSLGFSFRGVGDDAPSLARFVHKPGFDIMGIWTLQRLKALWVAGGLSVCLCRQGAMWVGKLPTQVDNQPPAQCRFKPSSLLPPSPFSLYFYQGVPPCEKRSSTSGVSSSVKVIFFSRHRHVTNMAPTAALYQFYIIEINPASLPGLFLLRFHGLNGGKGQFVA